MNVRKAVIVIAVVATIGGAVWCYVSPYLALERLKAAAQNGDAAELAELVDFPSVRESLKAGLKASVLREMIPVENNPVAALGLLMAGALVDPLVDAFVSPSAIAALLEGQRPANAQVSPDTPRDAKIGPSIQAPDRGPEVQMGYEGLSTFIVRFREKESGQDGITLVMKRHGLSWKLTAIKLPMR